MPTAGNEIVAMRDACAKQPPYQRNDCPKCGWPIEEHPRTHVLHCPLCGWMDSLSPGKGAGIG